MNLNTRNFAEARLTHDVGTRDDTFIVESTTHLPKVPFRISINREVVEVRRKSTTKLMDLRRGLENTTPRQHHAGDRIIADWTDEMVRSISRRTKHNQATIEDTITQYQFLSARGMNRLA